jgi:hypothetical protein
MAKSLVLGNGSLTVGFDYFGQVKDCYFDLALKTGGPVAI